MIPEDEASSFPDRFEVIRYKEGLVLFLSAFGAGKEEISPWRGSRRMVRLWTSSFFILRAFPESKRKNVEQKYKSQEHVSVYTEVNFAKDERTDGWTDGRTDRRTDRQRDGQTDG